MYINSNLCRVNLDVVTKKIDLIFEFINNGGDLDIKNPFIILIGSTIELFVFLNYKVWNCRNKITYSAKYLKR